MMKISFTGLVSLLLMTVSTGTLAAGAPGTDTIINMLQNLQTSIQPLMFFVVAVCYTVGIFLLLKATFMLKKYGQMKTMMASDTSIAKPMIVLFVAVGCIYLPSIIDVSLQSLWAYNTASVLKYPSGGGEWDAVIQPLIDVVRLFGLIAFVRGWIMLSKYGADQTQSGVGAKAMMHIVGGILSMNIVGAWSVIKATLGLS